MVGEGWRFQEMNGGRDLEEFEAIFLMSGMVIYIAQAFCANAFVH